MKKQSNVSKLPKNNPTLTWMPRVNQREGKGKPMTVEQAIHECSQNENILKATNYVRAAESKEERRERKTASLEAVMWNVRMIGHDPTATGDIAAFTGCCFHDIDGFESKKQAQMALEKVVKSGLRRHLRYASLSASGMGLRLIYKLAKVPQSEKEWKSYWQGLANAMNAKFDWPIAGDEYDGVKIDTGVNDAKHVNYLSWGDVGAYANDKPKGWKVKAKAKEKGLADLSVATGKSGRLPQAALESLVGRLRNKASTGRQEWIDVLFAIHYESQGAEWGRELAWDYSTRWEHKTKKNTLDDFLVRWNTVNDNKGDRNKTAGSLRHMLREQDEDSYQEWCDEFGADGSVAEKASQHAVAELMAEELDVVCDLTAKANGEGWWIWSRKKRQWQGFHNCDVSIRRLCHKAYLKLDDGKKVTKGAIDGCLGLLSQMEGIRIDFAKTMNKHPHLAGLPDGHTLNLNTGAITKAAKDEYITQCLPLAPVEGAPTVFEEALKGMFGRLGKKEFVRARRFILWHMHQSLYGKGPTKMFVMYQGASNTGKTILGELYYKMHGDVLDGGYGLFLDAEKLLIGDKEHREWMMLLLLARLVWADEFPDNRGVLNPVRVGPMSNRQAIDGRGFNTKTERKIPTICHPVFTTNNEPQIKNDGLKKRLYKVPMNVIQNEDDDFQEKLLCDDEIGKILNLLIEEAPRAKPRRPREWVEASENYDVAAGPMADFVRLRCNKGPDCKVSVSDFRDAFLAYLRSIKEDVEWWDGRNRRVASALKDVLNGLDRTSIWVEGSRQSKDAYKGVELNEDGRLLLDAALDLDDLVN